MHAPWCPDGAIQVSRLFFPGALNSAPLRCVAQGARPRRFVQSAPLRPAGMTLARDGTGQRCGRMVRSPTAAAPVQRARGGEVTPLALATSVFSEPKLPAAGNVRPSSGSSSPPAIGAPPRSGAHGQSTCAGPVPRSGRGAQSRGRPALHMSLGALSHAVAAAELTLSRLRAGGRSKSWCR